MGRLLSLLCTAYRDLHARRIVRATSSEDTITEEWFVHICLRWRQADCFGLVPVQQKQDKTRAKPVGRPPTIDFCFRDVFSRESYFGVECKLLDEGNHGHLKAYLDDSEGMGRFLSGKYAASTSAGSMVGYVRRGACSVVARELAKGVVGLKERPKLEKSSLIPDFGQLYQSKHDRSFGQSPFLCFHLLLAFESAAA